MKKYRNDIILIGLVLICAGLLILGIRIFKKPGTYVKVTADGELVKEFLLTDPDFSFKITQKDGKENTVTLKDGKVSVTEATCPDKLCIHQGEISSVGQDIICLPNKVIVTITGEAEKGTPDAVAE